jgi:ATP-dependent DNA helicase RecG
LSKVLEECVAYVLNNVKKVPDIHGTEMVEVPEYPEKVLREVIVNALVHRDYNLSDMNIILEIYPNRVIIRSPGYLMRPLTLEKIRSFQRVGSRCRNPRIALTFNQMHKMEKLGFGIPSMPILLKRHGLRPPDFDYFDGYFLVTLLGRALSPISLQTKAEVLSKLNKRQVGILDFIHKHKKITSEECTKHFHITRETANQDFKKLIDLHLIIRMGRGRGTYYVLK